MSRKVRIYVWMSWAQLVLGLLGWAGTHALMLATDPPESGWVFHVLIAISWWAIISTSIGVIFTADVRREQDNGGDS